ncbi:IS630 family transposase [Microbulbifer discodermiae]|uniref:IS630 family transposase n=1 Tax=Microbulbifer sp. 2201CG32-9 TaxID=3232309 RepID=UPI00345BB4AD
MDTPDVFTITAHDAATLESWIRSTSLQQGQITRAEIILALSEGMPVMDVAAAQRVSRKTVHKWKTRFIESGPEGLLDQARPGRPSVIDAEIVNRVLTLTTSRIPHESTHWSVSLMAKYAGVTTWQVRQIWNAADLKPHRLRTFKISNDPQFAEKVVDIVGLYMDPPDNALVLCVDEKTQIQALDRTQPGLPLAPGCIGSRTHDYKRNGTAALFAAFNILTGEVIGRVEKRSRSKEFLAFLKQVERQTPKDKELHIVLDNLSAHKTKEVTEWVANQPRIHFHFTPTSASWLNAVEGWFAQLERRALYRGIFTDVADLKAELQRFIRVHNRDLAKPFKWTKSADTILASVRRAKNVSPN